MLATEPSDEHTCVSAMQLGVDDRVGPWFRDHHFQRSRDIISAGSIPGVCKLARHGLPNTSRGKAWQLALGLGDITDR